MSQKTERIDRKAEAAFLAAARSVIELAKQTGTPVIVWDAGQIKRIAPEGFVLPAEQPANEKSASWLFTSEIEQRPSISRPSGSLLETRQDIKLLEKAIPNHSNRFLKQS